MCWIYAAKYSKMLSNAKIIPGCYISLGTIIVYMRKRRIILRRQENLGLRKDRACDALNDVDYNLTDHL